jgi:AraC-like DNA-binding protein
MTKVSVISSHILHGMPDFVRREVGEKALRQASRAAGIDLELVGDRHCFIPHAAVINFMNAAARTAGENNLGSLMVPMMDAAHYGAFGRYVLGAETLGQAIHRAISALPYHSTDDRMSLAVVGDEARYSYAFALAGCSGYETIAPAAAGVLLSVCKRYLPMNWRPLRVELDIGRPRHVDSLEAVFGCPVRFNAPDVRIVMERHHLGAGPGRLPGPIVTIEDVARDRFGEAPRQLLGVIVEQIRAQVLTGRVSIDRVAASIDTSVRTLQRELNRAGVDFRSLANAARMQRAAELLRGGHGSVTSVSAELGYSSPANFSRAFRKATGGAPRDFRLAR